MVSAELQGAPGCESADLHLHSLCLMVPGREGGPAETLQAAQYKEQVQLPGERENKG